MRRVTSLLTLIASNLVPLFGVIFFSWSLQSILILYWTENIMVGLVTMMKMRIAEKPIELGADPGFRWREDREYSLREKNSALLMMYGLFMGAFVIAHGLFLHFTFLRGYRINTEIVFPTIVLFANYIFSYQFNYVAQKEYLSISASKLFKDPISIIRLVILHTTIIIGGIFVIKIGSQNIWPLVILILTKTFFELAMRLVPRDNW